MGKNGLSRRTVLRSIGIAGAGAAGIGGMGAVTADTHEEIIGELTGDGNGGGSSGDGCQRMVGKSSDTQYDTIQAALDDANPGDNICVNPGVYEESLVVDTQDVVLASTGSATDTVIRSEGTTIDVQAAGFFLFKFKVRNPAPGGTAIDAGPSTGLRRNVVSAKDGIGVDTTHDFSAVDNEFVDNPPYQSAWSDSAFTGIGIRSTGAQGVTYIARNSFDRFRHGVKLVDCSNVGIRGNVFTFNRYDGVRIESTADGPTAKRFQIDRNEFRDNGLGMILFEEPDALLETVVAEEGNVFDNFSWGIYTAKGTVPYDVDDDGQTEPTPAPGPLEGGTVFARCNYWGVPTGPSEDDNPLSNRNWLTRKALPNGDKATDGIDYTPWQTQPADPNEELTCVGGTASSQL